MKRSDGVRASTEAAKAAAELSGIVLDAHQAELIARAVILSLREPSSETIDEGRRALSRDGLPHAWDTMIVTILNGGNRPSQCRVINAG
jgi:hypothetical protein